MFIDLKVLMFLIVGFALCCLSSIFASFCRYYELQFINKHGITSIKHYPSFLQGISTSEVEQTEKKRFSEEELKKVVQEAKKKHTSKHAHEHKKARGRFILSIS